MNRTRTQRAIGAVNMDAFARSRGVAGGAGEYAALLEYRRKLKGGGRLDERDAAAAHARDPRRPLAAYQALFASINAGAPGTERATRLDRFLAHALTQVQGRPISHLELGEIMEREGERLEAVGYADPITRKLDERNEHRDRHAGIDARARIEQARRAAMMSPDAQRRADIERAAAQHEGPTPTLYARDRREVLAQANERLAERMIKQSVRDADPHRAPDRGDDRRSDIALQIDRLLVKDASHDELALAENPLLEAVDDVATAEDARAKEA